MKKTLLIAAAALAFGTMAVAQDMPAQTPPATPDTSTPPATAPATPDTSATPPAAPAPDAAAAPAAPSGGNMSAATSAAGSTDDSNLPACSKSVTDKCVQKGGAGHKKAMHHPKK